MLTAETRPVIERLRVSDRLWRGSVGCECGWSAAEAGRWWPSGGRRRT